MSDFVVGLTGGIGSGKSTVAELFAAQGIDIIDADIIAREVVEPGKPALRAIIDKFGAGIVDRQGHLDRRQLRELVFNDSEKKTWLNQLLHPQIRQQMQLQTKAASSPYCILAIPLLVENQLQSLVDRVLVVDVTEQVQLTRAVARDKTTNEQVQKIIHAQASRQQRLAAADDVIYNNGDTAELAPQVKKLHNHYLTLATKTK